MNLLLAANCLLCFLLRMIHPTAVIDPGAKLAENVSVGAFAVIEADVVIAEGTSILTGTVLHSGSRIGKNCALGPYAVVGGEPMDTKFGGEDSLAIIGDDVVLREFATVHRASGEGAATRVGDGCYIMSYAHITHNVQLGLEVTLTTSAQLGGYCEVGDYAFIGSTAILHQFCRIGAYAIYGAGSASNQDVLPYSMVRGNPAKHLRLNKVGLERRGITGERYKLIEKGLRAIRRKDEQLLEALAGQSKDVKYMLEFLKSSERGICRFV